MTEQPNIEILALELMDWIPLKRYIEISHESREAIRKRIKIKAWKRGQQYSIPHGADVWVSLSGVRAWAARDIHDLKESVDLNPASGPFFGLPVGPQKPSGSSQELPAAEHGTAA